MLADRGLCQRHCVYVSVLDPAVRNKETAGPTMQQYVVLRCLSRGTAAGPTSLLTYATYSLLILLSAVKCSGLLSPRRTIGRTHCLQIIFSCYISAIYFKTICNALNYRPILQFRRFCLESSSSATSRETAEQRSVSLGPTLYALDG